MLIRDMKKSDVDAVYDYGFTAEHFMVNEDMGFWTKDQLVEWVTDDKDVLLVAEDNGKIVGFVLTQIHHPTVKASLENIFIVDEYRNKKIGSQMMEELIKKLKSKRIKQLYLTVRVENDSAKKFFEDIEFKKGFDFTWMERFL